MQAVGDTIRDWAPKPAFTLFPCLHQGIEGVGFSGHAMTKGFDPSFPLYCNDWLSSSQISVMTKEEQADYIWILCHLWASQDCSVPNDDAFLARLSRQGDNWMSGMVRKQLVHHPLKDGYLTNPKLFSVWEERQEYRAKQSEKGVKSGESRARAKKEAVKTKERLAKVEKQVSRLSTAIEPEFNHGSTVVQPDTQPQLNSSSSLSLENTDADFPLDDALPLGRTKRKRNG